MTKPIIKLPCSLLIADPCKNDEDFKVWLFDKGCKDYWKWDHHETAHTMNSYKESIFHYHADCAQANGYCIEDLFAFGENSHKRHSEWEEFSDCPGEYQKVTRTVQEMKELPMEALMHEV